MTRLRRILFGLLGLALLVVAAPALYFYGTTWIRGPVEVDVVDVYPIGNKGTLEAKVAFPDGDVHRVLNRDQVLLFWKFDSEGVDNRLSTAKKDGEKITAWFSGAYIPIFGDRTLFNHLNILRTGGGLPPGVTPVIVYLAVLVALGLSIRRLIRRLGAGARELKEKIAPEEG